MRKSLLFVFLCVFAVGLAPDHGVCGVIKLTIKATKEVAVSGTGKIRVFGEVVNTGDSTAYKPEMEIIIGDLSRRVEGLGNITAGGKIAFDEKFQDASMLPGDYVMVIRLKYQEQSGRWHLSSLFSRFSYLAIESSHQGLSVLVKPPVFNSETFWGKAARLKFFVLRSNHDKPLEVQAELYLPEGFMTKGSSRCNIILPPEVEKTFEFPVTAENLEYSNRPFHLVVRYVVDGRHYSELLQNNFIVEASDVYFKLYVTAGLLGFVLLAAFLLFNKTGKKGWSGE